MLYIQLALETALSWTAMRSAWTTWLQSCMLAPDGVPVLIWECTHSSEIKSCQWKVVESGRVQDSCLVRLYMPRPVFPEQRNWDHVGRSCSLLPATC